jgi:glutamine synthetase
MGPEGSGVDLEERSERSRQAESMLPRLADQGVVGVATTFVDNSGITRVKSVPLAGLPDLAAWGAGFSTCFDYFRFDDWLVAPETGEGPVGDLRIIPDLTALVVLAAQPGWAWAPGERYALDGSPHDQCSRQLLRRLTGELEADGFSLQAAVEIEWVVSRADGDEFNPAMSGPGYSMTRVIELSDYCRDVLSALVDQGVRVVQFHPEYAAGQLELSVAPSSPVEAADISVLVRSTIRGVGEAHGLRTSYSPKVDAAGVGNGGHIHLSLWRDGRNLMTGGDETLGLTRPATSFVAGVLQRLPGLLAIGAPGVVSYLRLVPQHWAGAYACWGPENREAALRLVTGSAGASERTANIEVKCFDLLANPYLALAALVAAGAAGLAEQATLPDPIEVDPAVLSDAELAARAIGRLPENLRDSLAAFLADDALASAFGPSLVRSLRAVRESEIELFEGASAEEVAAASRWAH